jgi:cytoplasmic iron level regulating protein YaaA (DUF328/UPF0246 family)
MLLLPPSEGKASGGTLSRSNAGWDPSDGTFGSLSPRRTELAALLAESRGGDEQLLGVTGEHLARAQAANSALLGAPTMPAWQRYTGVVWEHLDPATLPAAARRKIVVVSGLLGLVRGDDPTPDYRLKMGANPGVGKLSSWWRDDLSARLNNAARRKVVIDLLPQEHRSAWTPDARIEGVTVSLLEPSGKPGGHSAKAAKGELARALLVDGLQALDTWCHDQFELIVTPL